FPSGKAQLSASAIGVIERLGEVLAPFSNPIRVEGHTDDRPINTVAFYSNWELSAARAGSVVRVLESRGIDARRLAVIGYGEHRPTHTNATPEGRNKNRRVVLVILSTDPARDRDLGDAADREREEEREEEAREDSLAEPGELAVPPPALNTTAAAVVNEPQTISPASGTLPAP